MGEPDPGRLGGSDVLFGSMLYTRLVPVKVVRREALPPAADYCRQQNCRSGTSQASRTIRCRSLRNTVSKMSFSGHALRLLTIHRVSRKRLHQDPIGTLSLETLRTVFLNGLTLLHVRPFVPVSWCYRPENRPTDFTSFLTDQVCSIIPSSTLAFRPTKGAQSLFQHPLRLLAAISRRCGILRLLRRARILGRRSRAHPLFLLIRGAPLQEPVGRDPLCHE